MIFKQHRLASIVCWIVIGFIALYVVIRTSNIATVSIPTATPVPTLETKSTDLTSAIDVASSATYYTPMNGRWDGNMMIIDATQGPEFDNSGIVNSGKQNIFFIQQAIWKSGGFRANTIEVDVMVQLVDKYGKESSGVGLSATLNRDTASKFVWDNLFPDTAWDAYDTTWMLPSLQSS